MPGQAGDSQLMDQFRSNMQAFVDWAFLGIGGFFNVRLDTTLPYGGNPATLRLSDDSRYATGTAWDSFKSNWVWETNVNFANQPIQISGIYINNVFYPTGTNLYNINYPMGRVAFNSPIPTNSIVQVEYSYKYYNVYPDTVQWFKQLTDRTFRMDDAQFNMAGSGLWSIFPDSRAQLPAIVVEMVPRRSATGIGLGGGQYVWTDVLFHVLAETSFDRDNAVDIFTYQKDKRFFMFDKNMMARSGAFPLSAYGYLVNPGSTYPYLLNNYLWRYGYIRDTNIQRLENSPQSIYYGVAKWTLQISFPEI